MVFLGLEEILILHDIQIQKYGGLEGVRDLTLLESAIQRPQTSFDGKDLYSTIFDKAAALCMSLIQNHSFIDGNKRTGIYAALVFLELNGHILTVSTNELLNLTLNIANKKVNIEELSNFFEKKSVKLK